MKIVVLDGYTLNPGDLSWEALKTLAPAEIYDRTESDQIVPRARPAELVLTNKTPLSAETLRQLERLRYIGVLATGYNCVDVKTARELGVTVTNIPTYGTASVAQFTFALLLELCHHVQPHSDAARAGQWSQSMDWCFWLTPLVELAGKTMGVIGFGRIGRQVGQIAHAIGMRVMAAGSRRLNPPTYDEFSWATPEELLARADVVSLHCPLLPETEGLINTSRLDLMKPSALLINTSRGPLVVEQDLADALNGSRLAGAALDVLSEEPPPASNPLLGARNCIITPHIAWATREARTRLMAIAVANVAAFLRGRPENVVGP
jgi:glycerate dehydrogenase